MQLLPGDIEDIISDQYYSKITSYPINGEPNALSTCTNMLTNDVTGGSNLVVLKDVSGKLKAHVSNLV